MNRWLKAAPRWLQMLATLLSSAVGNASTVIATALLVRHLGGESFGHAALLTSAAVALGTVTSSGVGLYVIRAGARPEAVCGDAPKFSASRLYGQGLALLLGVCMLLHGLIQEVRPLYEYVVAMVALHLITADGLCKHRLIGRQHVLALAMATVAGALMSAGFQLAGAWTYGTPGYLAGFAAGSACQYAASAFACSVHFPSTPRVSLTASLRSLLDREFSGFVVPATLSASIVPLAHWAANFVAAQKTQRYGDVAVLTVAMQLFNIVIFAPTVLNKIILPRTIQAYARQSGQASRRDTYRQTAVTLLLATPAPVLAWALGDQLMALYKFDINTLPVVLCYAIGSVFACACIPISNYLVSHARMGLGLLTNGLWATTYLGLSALLPGGAVAVGFALMTAYGLNLAFALGLLSLLEPHRDGS